MRSIFTRRDGPHKSNNKPLPKVVLDLAKDQNAKVVFYEQSGLKTKYLGEMPIADAVNIAGSMESVLLEEYGGGEFSVKVINRDSEIVAKYPYSISGPSKRPKRTTTDDQETQDKKRTSKTDDALVAVMGKLADAAIGQKTSAAEDWERTLRLVKELRGDDGDMRQIQKEFMNAAIQRLMNPNETPIEDYFRFFQMVKEMQPILQPEDPMNSLIQLATPIISNLLGAKMAGVQPTINQNEIAQLQQRLSQLAAAQPNALPPGVQSQQELAAATPTQQPQPSLAGTLQNAATQPSTINMRHQIFYSAYIDEIRRALSAGEPDRDVAIKIVSAIEYAGNFQKSDPHPQVAGVLKSLDSGNPITIKSELKKFLESLPELGGHGDKQEAIIALMVKIYLDANDKQDQLNNGSDKDDDEDEETIPEAQSPD